MIIDWDRNPKQKELLKVSLKAVAKDIPVREIYYGGAVGGGKTFGVLGVFTILCKMYPGSRWMCFRDTFASHKQKTLSSMEKMLAGISDWRWNKDPSNYYVEKISTGSRIMFAGENREIDAEYGFLQGLELNGCLLEQTEDISYRFYDRVKTRLGRWNIDPMPAPLLYATFNPTQNWTKKYMYEPYRNGLLTPRQHFIEALPVDNPWTTEELWEQYKNLDPNTFRQMVKGDWSDMTNKDSLWVYAFDRSIHVPEDVENYAEIWNGNTEEELYLSFDFNLNPMCCSVIQHYNETIYVLKVYRIPNSNIYDLCDHILADWGDEYQMFITGDATGQNSTAMVEDNMTYYRIIAKKLDIPAAMFKLTSVNPKKKKNRVLVNSILSRYSVQMHPTEAEPLIYDCENVKVLADGDIKKADRNDRSQQADALDTFRYYLNAYFRNFVNTDEI